MAARKHRAPPLPSDLAVYRLGAPNEDIALFVWEPSLEAKKRSLTVAERAVLVLLRSGCSNAEIAAARGTALRTVANQVASILRKLGASSRFELIARGR